VVYGGGSKTSRGPPPNPRVSTWASFPLTVPIGLLLIDRGLRAYAPLREATAG
jgi:hypothetical protein